jgi:hypothetical protein
MPVTSDRHAARLVLQRVSEPSDSARLTSVAPLRAVACRSARCVRPAGCVRVGLRCWCAAFGSVPAATSAEVDPYSQPASLASWAAAWSARWMRGRSS